MIYGAKNIQEFQKIYFFKNINEFAEYLAKIFFMKISSNHLFLALFKICITWPDKKYFIVKELDLKKKKFHI